MRGSLVVVAALLAPVSCGPSRSTATEDGGAGDATAGGQDSSPGDAGPNDDGSVGHADSGMGDADASVADGGADAAADTAADAAGGVCVATDPTSLLACAAHVQAGTLSIIEIHGAIVCSGASACAVTINNQPVTIRGAAGASIRRIDHNDYPLFHVVGGPSAAITDLVIDEDADVPCTPVSQTNPPVENPSCARSVDLYGVADVVLDHVTIAYSKSIGAFFNTCGKARVTHARFIGSYQFGLEIGALPGGLVIEDTLFSQVNSNALVLYDVHGTSQAPVDIRRSLFDHNHRDDVYFTCGPQGNEQCSGGQLLLSGKDDFVTVEQTVIRRGFADVGSAPVGGVELNTPDVHDVTFTQDDVDTHGMWGVYANPNPTGLANISFLGNAFYANGTYPGYNGVDIGNFPSGVVTQSGTCGTAGCITVPIGALWALPGGPASWATHDLGNPQVTVNGVLTSSAANGQIAAASGATVVLSDGSTVIDQLVVP